MFYFKDIIRLTPIDIGTFKPTYAHDDTWM